MLFFTVTELQRNANANDTLSNQQSSQRYHALLINVYQYSQGWPDLSTKQKKVNSLAAQLKKHNYHIVKIDNPNSVRLKKEITEFIDTYSAANSTLFLFYSGHIYNDRQGRSCLIPSDSRLPSPDGVSGNSTLPVVELMDSMQNKQVNHILIAIDSSVSVNSPNLSKLNSTTRNATQDNKKGFSQVIVGAGSVGEAVPSQSNFVDTIIRAFDQPQNTGEQSVNIRSFCEFVQQNGNRNSWQRPWCKTNIGSSELDNFTISSGSQTNHNQSIAKSVLKVLPEPDNARIRILNIGPKYTTGGLSLSPGRYHIEVSSKECEKPITKWVTLQKGKNLNVPIILKNCTALSNQVFTTVASAFATANQSQPITPRAPEFGFTLIKIPKGSFQMGGKRYQEGPIHTVKIKNDFYIMNTEVTASQYVQYLRQTNQQYKALQDSDLPAVNVTWDDANKYASWLTSQSRHTYRLPTEAEWEYVAKQGMPSDLGEIQFPGKMQARIMPVNKSWRNTMNIYGMPGNVWEWCSDCWTARYETSNARNRKCSNRVMRGGSWRDSLRMLSVTSRSGIVANTQAENIGFRLVRD